MLNDPKDATAARTWTLGSSWARNLSPDRTQPNPPRPRLLRSFESVEPLAALEPELMQRCSGVLTWISRTPPLPRHQDTKLKHLSEKSDLGLYVQWCSYIRLPWKTRTLPAMAASRPRFPRRANMPLEVPASIIEVMSDFGPCATDAREPRQVRKEATVASLSVCRRSTRSLTRSLGARQEVTGFTLRH